MVTCTGCGRAIELTEDGINIGERDQTYHLKCTPDDLLADAITEGNAIVARGVTYYVNRYLPNKIRTPSWPKKGKKLPTDKELPVYVDLFARMLREYRRERDARKK